MMNLGKLGLVLGALGPLAAGSVGCSGNASGPEPTGASEGATQTSQFEDAIAVSTSTGQGVRARLVSKASGEELASVEWSSVDRVMRWTVKGVKYDEATPREASLADVSLEQANVFAHEVWAREANAAHPEGTDKAYTTCSGGPVCGPFSLPGYQCWACTSINYDCSTDTFVNCMYA